MLSRIQRASVLVLAAASLAAIACSDAEDEIDQFSDCIDICGRYKECFDDDYDTDDCASRCEDMDFNNGNNDVDQCENCLDDRSCAESVFPCANDCGGIVP